jgi:hypothetical protein
MVLEAVDFFRDLLFFVDFEVDFFDDVDEPFFLLLLDEAALFLLDGWVVAEDGELWAGKALDCSINPARTAAVNRLNDIVAVSLTRSTAVALRQNGCKFRFPIAASLMWHFRAASGRGTV